MSKRPPSFKVGILCLGILGFSITFADQNRPGLKLRLSQSGINYAVRQGIWLLSKDVEGQSVPDQQGTGDLGIDSLQYYITGMVVTSFSPPVSDVRLNASPGIRWNLSGASLSVRGDWRYQYELWLLTIRDSGKFDVTVSGIDLDLGMKMGTDSSGRPTISARSCSCDIRSVQVKFSQSVADLLYNLFSHVVEKALTTKLESLLCVQAKRVINVNAAGQLARMMVQYRIDGLGLLDYRLAAAPILGNFFVESLHKGEFFWRNDNSEAPFTPSALPPGPTGVDKMINIWLSDYVINTLGYRLHRHGMLQYNLGEKHLGPKGSLLRVSCSTGICIGSLIPELGQLYPGGVMELGMRTTSPPKLNIQPSAIEGYFSGIIDFNVRVPAGGVKLAFSTRMTVSFGLAVDIVRHNLTASIKSVRANAAVTNSSICNLNLRALEIVFNGAVNEFIVPQLIEKGREGVALPMLDDITFTNPELTQVKGALFLQTDARYTPNAPGYRGANSAPPVNATPKDGFYVNFTMIEGACVEQQTTTYTPRYTSARKPTTNGAMGIKISNSRSAMGCILMVVCLLVGLDDK